VPLDGPNAFCIDSAHPRDLNRLEIMSRSFARQELAGLLELTLRSADVRRSDVERTCILAREHCFQSICVNSSRLVEACYCLEDSDVKLTCAVGFPLGTADADVKRYETEVAVDFGAHFIEVSVNLGLWGEGDESLILGELFDVVDAADERPVSVHLGSALLSPERLWRIAVLVSEAGAKSLAFFGNPDLGKTAEIMKHLRVACPPQIGLKVDQDRFEIREVANLLEAGATRFGVTDGLQLLESLA
jgi:deoxyribose-phosphate aldolase